MELTEKPISKLLMKCRKVKMINMIRINAIMILTKEMGYLKTKRVQIMKKLSKLEMKELKLIKKVIMLIPKMITKMIKTQMYKEE